MFSFCGLLAKLASEAAKWMLHRRAAFSRRRSHNKWMFDISPVCQANLALWHAITGLITAVCGLEGTRALLAALTGPDRLIRSAGTRNSNSQTPHISYAGSRRLLQVQEALFPTLVFWHLSFLLLPSLTAFSPHQRSFTFWLALVFLVPNQMLPAVYHLCGAQPFIPPLENKKKKILNTHTVVLTKIEQKAVLVSLCWAYSIPLSERSQGEYSVDKQRSNALQLFQLTC